MSPSRHRKVASLLDNLRGYRLQFKDPSRIHESQWLHEDDRWCCMVIPWRNDRENHAVRRVQWEATNHKLNHHIKEWHTFDRKLHCNWSKDGSTDEKDWNVGKQGGLLSSSIKQIRPLYQVALTVNLQLMSWKIAHSFCNPLLPGVRITVSVRDTTYKN